MFSLPNVEHPVKSMGHPASATRDADLTSAGSAVLANWAVYLPAAILFCVGAVTNIMVPGLYMDAVNPDYMVVRVLNPGAEVPVWILPGTLLFGLFPVIGQIYHGALPFYLGLPVYALFGTGIVGVRLANLLFGLLVLMAAAFFLKAFRVRSVIAGVCLAALALDPGFLFSFRIQFYITLLPLALMLSSVALVEHRRMAPAPGIAVGAGFLAGASIYGYFIYAFLVPAAALHAARAWRGDRHRRRLWLGWIGGLVLGGSPYLLGMILILFQTGGLRGFISFLANNLAGLAPASSPLSLAQRAVYFKDMVSWTTLDVGPSAMMLQKALPLSLPGIKTFLLVALPALGLLVSLIRAPRSPGLFVLAGFVSGEAALTALFGNRLWLQHFALVLPLLYIALALTLERLASAFGPRRARAISVAVIAIILPLIAGNLIDRQAMLAELSRTGGVGLASDAIERFSEDSRQNRTATRAFFPDWGVFMPFEMITRGHIPLVTDFTPQDARRTLCEGKDVLLALMADKDPARLPIWIDDIGWGRPDVTVYRQYDGVAVLTAVRWHADAASHPICPS